MTTLMRGVLWAVWLIGVGWLWTHGDLGVGGALLIGAMSLLVFLWPHTAGRRRRTELRYVEMGKQPMGLR